jgi:lipid-binding SYLF domain-containing protein
MKLKFLFVLTLAASLPASSFAAAGKAELDSRLTKAADALSALTVAGDKSIPLNILKDATCVGIVPGLKKAAFLVGGSYGQGVVTCKTADGKWSAPAFIRMEGGSFGLQLGGQSTDLVIIAVNNKGFQDLLKSKFKIGGDVAASAGPVGRNSQADTDWKLNAELLSYSRSKGLFAGIDLTGTVVSQNSEDTDTFYGTPHPFEEILKGNVVVPQNARPFVRTVAREFRSSNQ